MNISPLRRMVGAGWTALRRYPGLIVVLYLVQLIASAFAGLIVARALASAVADRPSVDLAASGDLLSIVQVAQETITALVAAGWASISLVGLYALLSWATTSGLIATLQHRPVSRQHTAETFGAGAASNLLAFARLWLWSLILYAAVAAAMLLGLSIGLDGLGLVVSLGQLLAKLIPALIPGLLLWWLVNTAVDYARIELVRQHRKSALRALLRGFADTFTQPWPLLHAAVFYLIFFGASAIYWNTTAGVELSAVAYFVLRQGLSVTRFVAKIWLISGQVELASERRRGG